MQTKMRTSGIKHFLAGWGRKIFSWFSPRSTTVSRRTALSHILELEDRSLLSGTPLDPSIVAQLAAIEAANAAGSTLESPIVAGPLAPSSPPSALNDPNVAPERITAASQPAQLHQQTRREVVFIDSAVSQAAELAQQVRDSSTTERQLDVHVLEKGPEALHQIGEVLASYSNLDALHLISHGNSDGIQIGSTYLTPVALKDHARQIGDWSIALKPGADVLIYGCNVAEHSMGQELVQQFGVLTGADVAASMNATGATRLGGDWTLEYAVGQVDTSSVVDAQAQENWHSLLSSITVTTISDVLDGNTSSISNLLANKGADGQISLREAILASNNTAGTDYITLPTGIYILNSGQIEISDSVDITGADPATTVIDGNGLDRLFETRDSSIVSFSRVTIQNGLASDKGAIFVNDNSVLTITDSVLTNNDGQNGDGGAIHVHGTLHLDRVLLSNNTAKNGGAIYFHGANGGSLNNVTISGNTTTSTGGGIWTDTALSIRNTTITQNSASDAGGIYTRNGEQVTISNTIIAGNSAIAENKDVVGTFTSDGYNLVQVVGSATGLGGDITGFSANLNPLANNGGWTPTHSLATGSLAIDAGTTSGAPIQDQRGFGRSGVTDIGAFEFNGVNPSNSSPFIITDGGGATASIGVAENTTIVTTVTAIDADLPAQLLTYSIVGGADAARFTINGSTGALSFVDAPDHETPTDSDTNNVYEVTVQVSDGNGGMATQAIRVSVTPVNDNAPIITSNGGGSIATINVAENTTAVTTVTATDGDLPAQTLTYSIGGGADAARFTINSSTGALSFVSAPDFETPTDGDVDNAYLVIVQASDGNGETATQAISVVILDVGSLVVTTTNDTVNGDTSSIAALIANPGGDGISLREAILAANNSSNVDGIDVIRFDIDGGGVSVVNITSPLPAITDAVSIDGWSQPGYSSTPLIELNGTAAGAGVSGLVLGAGSSGSTIRGLVINNFNGSGILINGGSGVNSVLGNFIGTDATGMVDQGNGSSGIELDNAGANNVIGGTSAGEGNVIAHNSQDGIALLSGSARIVGNSIFSNGGLGIDLNDDGVTPNDLEDLDLGPNGLQNFPILSTATGNGTDLAISGMLSTTLLGNFTIDFYSSPSVDATGYGEGQRYLGSTTISSGLLGIVNFSTVLSGVSIVNGHYVTATVTDAGGRTSEFSQAIMAAAPNSAPTAVANTYSVGEDSSLDVNATLGVLANDSDPDGNPLNVVKVSDPTNGTLSLNADGSFTYVPNANFHGTDSFTYKANDGSSDSNVVTVTITVNPVNDAPAATANSHVVNEDTVLNSSAPGVLGNDLDVDGDALSAVLVDDVSNGVLTLNADGSFQYTPNANFHGTDSFTYKANDGSSDSNVVTVTITVNPVNDAPAATANSHVVNEDTVLNSSAPGVLGNDLDVDGDALSAVLVDDVSNGVLTLNADGSFQYTPNANFHGTDSFTYKANDGSSDSSVVTVTITVTSVNDAPTHQVPGPQNTFSDSNLYFQALDGNQISLADVEAAGTDPMQVSLNATNGRIQLWHSTNLAFLGGADDSSSMTIQGTKDDINSAMSRVTFKPDDGFTGSASLVITTSDLGNSGTGGPQSKTDTIAIQVQPAPQPPADGNPPSGGQPILNPPLQDPTSGSPSLPPLQPPVDLTPFLPTQPIDAGPDLIPPGLTNPGLGDPESTPMIKPGSNQTDSTILFNGQANEVTDRNLGTFAFLDQSEHRFVVVATRRFESIAAAGDLTRQLQVVSSIHVESTMRPLHLLRDTPERVETAEEGIGRTPRPDLHDSASSLLDASRQQINAQTEEFETGSIVTTGLVATAGYLLFNPRSLAWILALAASNSAWKRFDPLEVIYAWEEEDQDGFDQESKARPWWNEVGLK